MLPEAVDGKVPGHAQSVEDSDPVLVYAVPARLVHLSEHRHRQVHVLDGHNGVLYKVVGHQLVLDVDGSLFSGHTGQMNLAEHREVYVPVAVQGVSRQITVAAQRRIVTSDVSLDHRQVEQHHQLRVAAVDQNRYLVLRGQPDGHRLRYYGQYAVRHYILKIRHLLGNTAGAQHNDTDQGRYQNDRYTSSMYH